jgi:hypothetical protein
MSPVILLFSRINQDAICGVLRTVGSLVRPVLQIARAAFLANTMI